MKFFKKNIILLISLLLVIGSLKSNPLIGGYYQSWSAQWVSKEADHSLTKIPSYVSYILISFANPNMNYTPGSNTFSQTGIQFSMEFVTVKNAINMAKRKNPNQKFLLSVGGATYQWSNPNYSAMIAFINDLGLDGIDIDYEKAPYCQNVDTANLSCNTDNEIINIINNLKQNMPAGKLLTAAVFSVGAYGTPEFPNSRYGPASNYAGMWVNPLKKVGDKLDTIFIMSYDASPAYSPIDGFNSYRSIFHRDILLGLEVPPEAWGGYILTVQDALKFASHAGTNGSGVFIWSFHKQGSGSDSNTFISPICAIYGYGNCNEKIPLN